MIHTENEVKNAITDMELGYIHHNNINTETIS
jgi:hypothetical protein